VGFFWGSTGGFLLAREAEGKGGQKVASAGGLEVCKGHAGHGGLGGVLEGCCLGRGVLWVGSGAVTAVGVVQEEERQRGGVLGAFLFFPPFLTARVRAEGAGVDRGGVHEHGDRV
jgi:hypothetical protein